MQAIFASLACRARVDRSGRDKAVVSSSRKQRRSELTKTGPRQQNADTPAPEDREEDGTLCAYPVLDEARPSSDRGVVSRLARSHLPPLLLIARPLAALFILYSPLLKLLLLLSVGGSVCVLSRQRLAVEQDRGGRRCTFPHRVGAASQAEVGGQSFWSTGEADLFLPWQF